MTDPTDLPDPDDVDLTARKNKAIQGMMQLYQRRLERELVAAWMAGYDYLDVVKAPMAVLRSRAGADIGPDAFALPVRFIPRREDSIGMYGPYTDAQRYGLDRIDYGMAADVRSGPNGGDSD